MNFLFTILVAAATVCGPDGRLCVSLSGDKGSGLNYSVTYDGKTLLKESPLGLVTDAFDYSSLIFESGETSVINEHYELDRIKRSSIDYSANVLLAHCKNAAGQKLDVEFRVSDNDVAFRYLLPKEGETGSVRVLDELTGFSFPDGTTTFLTPQSDAMIGWKRTKPSYEEYYGIDKPMAEPSQYGHGYTFPCLFKVGSDGWVLVGETGVDSRYCGSHLSDYSAAGYKIAFPMAEENNGNGTPEPAFSLPGATPWRTITVGADLKPIVESTVTWDVVEPRYKSEHVYEYGKGTWSWILWQDASINYEDQVKYVDLAAAMGFKYVLIDNFWDQNIGRDRMADLVKYADNKGVGLFLWYSSSGWWNDIVQGPVNVMSDPIARKPEMRWLKEIGVKGIKVDFFGGDKQETMRHYESILSDADDNGLMVIFHGCTMPRGWERMYPNYVGSEAVRASENLIFGQYECEVEASNATLHPFIRNAQGCMEFGGCFLNKHLSRDNVHGTTRRTTDSFELATAVLFQNPIQNFALAPNNLEDAPELALNFLRKVPTTWDDTEYLAGEPGKFCVISRRKGSDVYIAGICAAGVQDIDLASMCKGYTKSTIIYTEGGVLKSSAVPAKLKLAPNDGFVIVASGAKINKLDVSLKKLGAPIQDTMYGIFFEDINFAADGGLYAEMVKNRSFEYPYALQGWKAFGKVEIKDDGPFERNPHYVRLMDPGHRDKRTGLDNEGYFGISVQEGKQYRFTVWARVPEGGNGAIRVELVNTASMGENHQYTENRLAISGSEWKKYEVIIDSPVTDPKAALRIFLQGVTTIDLEHVSLFPVDTWKGREGGLRKDLAQALYDLHPGIFRFPGGCIVEGTDEATRYQWKNTVGPVENRPLNENRWEYTFDYRFYPDYYQSYGLGFFEFFQLAEEIGAEPLPVLNCSLICQFQNDDADQIPIERVDEFVQDALDLIEFANGDVNTTWGKVRAEMGHPEPFNLKFIGIGNEQWGEIFPERLEKFIGPIRAAYPDIKIVGSAGPNSEGDQFDYLWPEMRRLGADLVDEHYYRPYDWFLSQGARYDNYDRKGPKVFAGEYACHAKGQKWNHYYASLLEAALMTGLERNADIVHMATYAPLFAHVEGWQWRPDMIWYDNVNSVRTCSYYVQQMYSAYKGKNTATLTMNGANVTGAEGQNGLFASAVTDGDLVYVKVVNTSESEQKLDLCFNGLKKKQALETVKTVLFSNDDMNEENSLETPDAIVPVEQALAPETGTSFDFTIEPRSFRIYVLKYAK